MSTARIDQQWVTDIRSTESTWNNTPSRFWIMLSNMATLTSSISLGFLRLISLIIWLQTRWRRAYWHPGYGFSMILRQGLISLQLRYHQRWMGLEISSSYLPDFHLVRYNTICPRFEETLTKSRIPKYVQRNLILSCFLRGTVLRKACQESCGTFSDDWNRTKMTEAVSRVGMLSCIL